MTIQKTILNAIQMTDSAGTGLSIDQCLNMVKQAHPGCRTSKACISWYMSKARRGQFKVTLPLARHRATKTKIQALPVTWQPAPSMTGL